MAVTASPGLETKGCEIQPLPLKRGRRLLFRRPRRPRSPSSPRRRADFRQCRRRAGSTPFRSSWRPCPHCRPRTPRRRRAWRERLPQRPGAAHAPQRHALTSAADVRLGADQELLVDADEPEVADADTRLKLPPPTIPIAGPRVAAKPRCRDDVSSASAPGSATLPSR